MFFNLIFLYVSESIYPADKDSYSPEYDCLLRANSYIFIILLVFAFQNLSKSHFWTNYFRIFSHNCIGKKNGRGIISNFFCKNNFGKKNICFLYYFFIAAVSHFLGTKNLKTFLF